MQARSSNDTGTKTAVRSHLFEFRAGKMSMVENIVHPDPRKGFVYLKQSDEGHMHFCWKDRKTGIAEDDIVVIPKEHEFKRVGQCKTGRVYVLKFNKLPRRLFYWMQDPHIDRDETIARRVNDLINHPPAAQSATQSARMHKTLAHQGPEVAKQDLKQPNVSDQNLNNARELLEPPVHLATSAVPELSGSDENLHDPRTTDARDFSEFFPTVKRLSILAVRLPESFQRDVNKSTQITETIALPAYQKVLMEFLDALVAAGEDVQVQPDIALTPEAIVAVLDNNLEGFYRAMENALPLGVRMGALRRANSHPKVHKSIEDDDVSQ